MDRLRQLRKSLLDMDGDEILEYIRKLRVDRRITKDKPATVVKKKKAADKSKSNVSALLSKLSDKELAQLLGDIGDDEGNGTATTEDQDQGQNSP